MTPTCFLGYMSFTPGGADHATIRATCARAVVPTRTVSCSAKTLKGMETFSCVQMVENFPEEVKCSDPSM